MFHLNYRDSRPIYEQIKEQLRKLIVAGVIKTDEKLPSIREVATNLSINPNTIQRAYRELESEGYIYTIAGKGSFVAPSKDIALQRERNLLEQLSKIVTELSYLGYSSSELCNHIKKQLREVQPNDTSI